MRIRGVGVFEAGALDEARLLRVVDALGPGDHELGAHPGLAPPDVPEDSRVALRLGAGA